MLAGKDTRPFRGKATTVLSNDCGKFDETDQAHAMEGVLDSSRRENHWKIIWTWPKPQIARFTIKDPDKRMFRMRRRARASGRGKSLGNLEAGTSNKKYVYSWSGILDFYQYPAWSGTSRKRPCFFVSGLERESGCSRQALFAGSIKGPSPLVHLRLERV